MTKKKSNKSKILWRYGLITIGFLLLSIAIVVKMFETTIVDAKAWNERAKKDLSRLEVILPERGNLLSDNGNILACNIQVYDTKVDLTHAAIKNIEGGIPWEEVNALADSLDKYYPTCSDFASLPEQEKKEKSWHKKLSDQFNLPPSKRSTRVVICRKKSLDDFEKIKSFPLFKKFADKKGFRNPVYTETHNMRIYPYGAMARRSIGRVNENKQREFHGYSGVEYDLDSLLYGTPGLAKKVTLTRGVANWVSKPAMRGYDIQTTLDIDLQDMLEEELTNICTESKAEWGTAVLLEVETGEIKAIANVQHLDDGSYGEALNRAVRGFEPGSVMKPISLMIAFEDGLVKNVTDQVDCSPFMRTTDPHGSGMKSMKQVIEQSSNTGISRVIFRGYQDHPEKFYDRLAEIGFFEPLKSGIDKDIPYMRRLTEWNEWAKRKTTMTERHLDLARQAYGYNTTIPPLYTAAIYNAIANGGKFVRPHLMKRMTNDSIDSIIPISYVRDRICSEATAEKVRICLKEPVWGSHGTARMVQDDRVMIAGKTGTAYPMMSDYGGGYDHSRRRYAFCGFFPYEKPKYTCMALILASSGTSANRTSGQVVKNIALKMYARGMLDNTSGFDHTPKGSTPLMVNSTKGSAGTLTRSIGANGMRKYAPNEKVNGGVPDVKGYDAMSAVRLMERAGYNVSLKGTGHVLTQSVAPGTKVAKGTKVVLTLGT